MNGLKKQCKSPGCIFVACFRREGLSYRHKHGKAPKGAMPHKPKDNAWNLSK